MNNYFCVLPFFGREFTTGNETHCCLLPRNYNIESIKTSILAGERSPFCSACWNLEDAGLVSDRNLKNSALDFYWDRDINIIESDVREGKYKTIMVKNGTSNTCNSTCVTCGSYASSAWAPLEVKLNLKPIAPKSMSYEDIDKKLNFKELVTLTLVGGEPLYEKANFYILEKLIEHDNTKCFISITTNGSVALTQRHKDLLAQFKNVHIGLSIDGVGPVFEYMRFPLKWDLLLDNLSFFRTITDNISANYTISNLNALYHHETTEWFNEQGLKYHYNPVITPRYFRPGALPANAKQKIFDKFGHTKDLEFIIGAHTEQDDKDFARALVEIQKQDGVKNISIKDYLPDFCRLIETD